MRLTTIGTGTGTPSAKRVSSAHLVEGNGVRLLLDCGSGSAHRMASLGIDWMGITHVAITHFHPDHISDIPTLLFAWRYGAIPFRSAPVEFIGPTGFADFFGRLDAVFDGDLRTLGFSVTVSEHEPGSSLELAPGLRLTSRKVPHNDESVAYSIESGRRRVVYSGDTSFDPSFAEWAKDCDLLLLECSLPESMAVPTHMTPEQCAHFAAIARPAALALTHFYPPLEVMDVAGIVAAGYDGPVHLVHDGWTIELED